MRKIKFRIWHKGRKEYLWDDEASLHCGSDYQIDPFTGEVSDFVFALDHPDGRTKHIQDWYQDENGQIIPESPYVLEQFTGGEDRDGKEIYENDIVLFGHDSDQYTSVVEFSEGAFGVKVADDYWPALFEIYDIKVIGNIHENTDLL